MEKEITLLGSHIEAFCPYSLQINDYSKHEFLCHYLTAITKIFLREFPPNIHSMVTH